MLWGNRNDNDTEETTRQGDAQTEEHDVEGGNNDKNDEGSAPTREACEGCAEDNDEKKQGDSESDTSEDETHGTQRSGSDGSKENAKAPKWGVKRLKED